MLQARALSAGGSDASLADSAKPRTGGALVGASLQLRSGRAWENHLNRLAPHRAHRLKECCAELH